MNLIVKSNLCSGMWINGSLSLISSKQHRSDSCSITVRAALVKEKPAICTADQLHYVQIPNTDCNGGLTLGHKPIEF